MGDWCILRCAASRTLALAESLTEAEFEVWTPVQRKDGTKDEVEPMIHTFVFANADRLMDLVALSRSSALTYRRWNSDKRRMVSVGHPPFSVFQDFGKFARVPDAALSPLRAAERRRKPRGQVRSYRIGDHVKLVEGAYEGLRGVIEAVAGKQAVVAFPGFVRSATIPMWMLLDDDSAIHVDKDQSERAAIARAA